VLQAGQEISEGILSFKLVLVGDGGTGANISTPFPNLVPKNNKTLISSDERLHCREDNLDQAASDWRIRAEIRP